MNLHLLAENISHGFGKRTLFENISFEAKSGEIISVTGANGSGKSTLLKIIADLIEPLSGKVNLSINRIPIERAGSGNISFVSPELRWYGSISAKENLDLYFFNKEERAAGIRSVTRFGIGNALDKPLCEFSTGMVQRFSLAVAFASKSPLMILDEPLSHLDDDGKKILCQIIGHEKEKRIMIIAQTEDDKRIKPDRRISLG
jgi:ABC-type multidrug transport system ATPase subunit